MHLGRPQAFPRAQLPKLIATCVLLVFSRAADALFVCAGSFALGVGSFCLRPPWNTYRRANHKNPPTHSTAHCGVPALTDHPLLQGVDQLWNKCFQPASLRCSTLVPKMAAPVRAQKLFRRYGPLPFTFSSTSIWPESAAQRQLQLACVTHS